MKRYLVTRTIREYIYVTAATPEDAEAEAFEFDSNSWDLDDLSTDDVTVEEVGSEG